MKKLLELLKQELKANLEAYHKMANESDKRFFEGVVAGLSSAINELERRL